MKTKIRVVLADDHPVVRDGLAAMVNQQADMEWSRKPAMAMRPSPFTSSTGPIVLVLDLRMPKRDGVSVVQRVLELHPKACILIMTTYDGDEDIFQCLSQGAKGLPAERRTPAGNPLRHPRRERGPSLYLLHRGREGRCSAWRSRASRSASSACLQLVAQGRSNKDIARRLSITEGTAKTHVKAILTKLDAISRTEAVAVAHKRGLIHL